MHRNALLLILFVIGCIFNLANVSATEDFEIPHHQHFTRESFPAAQRSQWCVKITDHKTRADRIKELESKHNLVYAGRVGGLEEYHLFDHRPELTNDLRHPHEVHKALQNDEAIEWMQLQIPRQHHKRNVVERDVPPLPNDPDFVNQWHIKNRDGGVDLNILGAWENRIWGEGIGISIVDDGLEWRNLDFQEANGARSRYNSTASWDWNDSDGDPSPGHDGDNHGTQCGGLAFGGAFNRQCGVGIAYKATFSGQRLISKATTDAMEASAFTLEPNTNHIYSCSWGPTDDGHRLEGPGPLARAALKKGVETGRGGKGSIFVWAGGNGHQRGDNVNYDGYANSIYTIAVAAVDQHGKKAPYSEEGAPLVASGVSSPPGIHTTAIHDRCSGYFSGTSATAPMIAGVVALILNANNDVTWRDMQHILIKTARKNDPADSDWALNGAGLWVNHKYGYGLIDTTAAVNMALTSPLLPPARAAPTSAMYIARPDMDIPDDSRPILTSVHINESFYVEHVELTLRAVHARRGDLHVELISPSGTNSVLAVGAHPDGQENYQNWKFTTMRCWEEPSQGTWTLKITDKVANMRGQLNAWLLTVYGRDRL